MLNAGLVRRLGEAGCTREDGRVGLMDLLARAGLPIPEGFVLTREGHRNFLGFSGLAGALRAPAEGPGDAYDRVALLLRDEPEPPSGEEALTRLVREAVLDLEARTVAVLSEEGRRSGLSSLPEVLLAIRRAWLSEEGLRRQVTTAAAGGEIPTWPVLVQRERSPEYTGWTTTEDLRGRSRHPARKTQRGGIPLHDVEPVGGSAPHPDIARLTREARSVLGDSVRLEWGLQDGQWYVLSASRQDPERRRR